ncbi:MAG: hypothetical protein RLZZ399_1412 [Verrucomicrobiota bacterium]|jgi:hypothetical protein
MKLGHSLSWELLLGSPPDFPEAAAPRVAFATLRAPHRSTSPGQDWWVVGGGREVNSVLRGKRREGRVSLIFGGCDPRA